MIRVQLPAHLQTLARVPCEVAVDVTGVLSGKTVGALASANNSIVAFCGDGTLVSWGSNRMPR